MTTTTTAPDAALLPCAHCGGKAQYYHRSSDDGWSNTDWVSCSDDNCGVSTALEASKGEAIAAWNRRAGQSHADAGLLAALERMVYETTHLSPMKSNGDHDCTIKADALAQARAAIAAAKGA